MYYLKNYRSVFVLFCLIACQSNNKEQSVRTFESPIDSLLIDTTQLEYIDFDESDEMSSSPSNRVAWQKPRLIIDRFGSDLKSKTIADIGAGPTGFFTFYLAQKNAHVIAIDIVPSVLAYIEKEKANLDSVASAMIKTRLGKPLDPNLTINEVDGVLIVNTIGYIPDKKRYLSTLYDKLKENGRVVIVDFKMKRLPEQIAPPKNERVYQDVLEEILYQAGYKNIVVDDQTLEYQYIITADK